MTHEYPLGRLEQFDDRSKQFPIRPMLPTGLPPRSYNWRCCVNLDQKREGACVGFAWAHELAARPAEIDGVVDNIGRTIYKKAQVLDEWPGENYEGTSVLAGVKAVQTLYPGAINEYRWAFGIDDVLQTLSYHGPVVLGVKWYSGMYTPDADGMIKVTGDLVGGHAILARGINVKQRKVRLHNSWGASWGKSGCAFLSFDDLALLLKRKGEACVPVHRNKIVLG